jgi:hypothetical protein
MSGLLVKCLALIAIIHALRVLSRRIGPRGSSLLLGLPSSTAIVLVLCAWEKGPNAAAEMADASLLGLVAAVALPVAYAQAVRNSWPLGAALACAVACYATVAFALGSLHPVGSCACLVTSSSAIAAASYVAGRIAIRSGLRSSRARSQRLTLLIRTTIPAVYVILVAIAGSAASPSWAGLVSTFPSMSLAILAVTHLEEGPAEASQIARTLPLANLSTVAFLAVFRFASPLAGLGCGTLGGYGAALFNALAIEIAAGHMSKRKRTMSRKRLPERLPWRAASRVRRHGLRAEIRPEPRHFGRRRMALGRRFAPLLEILPC